MMNNSLKIMTYNVRGLSSPQKRGCLWQEVRHQAVDIIYMQEMHFMPGSVPKLPLSQYNQWLHTLSPIAKARGVSIAFGKTCPLISTAVQTDPEGRFLFIKATLYGFCYTFACLYAPNNGMVDFLLKTLRKLE